MLIGGCVRLMVLGVGQENGMDCLIQDFDESLASKLWKFEFVIPFQAFTEKNVIIFS